jgi:hypothetical protein
MPTVDFSTRAANQQTIIKDNPAALDEKHPTP